MHKLLILMYHQIYHPSNPISLTLFEDHLKYLSSNFKIVVPNDAANTSNELNICLTFDDAYFDFYYYIYPLLKKYHCKAILCIPTSFIIDKTSIEPNIRLNVPYPDGFKDEYKEKVPLCTWHEIQEMVASGVVVAASHSHTHINLKITELDVLLFELDISKKLIQTKTNAVTNIFIYPFGQMSRTVQKIIYKYFTYSMRIGTALNKNWSQPDGLYYRVDADELWKKNKKINHWLLFKWHCQSYINLWRGR